MIIHEIQHYIYRLPFVKPFSTAHGTLTVREGAILVLTTSQGITGLGEIAPFPGLSRETLTEALAAFHDIVLRLRGKTLEAALAVLDKARDSLPPSTMCGIEMALLDAMERVGVQFIEPSSTEPSPINATFPSIARTHVKVNAVIGSRAMQDAVQAALQAKRDGFSCVKLKVGICSGTIHCATHVQQEIARIAAVRAALGSDIALRLDANEAWTFEQAHDILTQCVPFNIEYVEQPLKANDIEGMRRLRQVVPIMLAADEAVGDRNSAREILMHKLADVLVFKPQLIGGLRACRDIVEEAAHYGVACVLTTTIESGVSLAATLRLAASLPEITLACGFGTLPLLADDLIQEQFSIENGVMAVPAGRGWGVTLDESALRSLLRVYPKPA